MAAPGPPLTPRPPGRALLRVAGALTQVGCGACLLIGTIGLVLVQQNSSDGIGTVAAWLVAAMVGLVFGGLIYRGGLVSMLVAAAIDAGFGIALIAIEYDSLRRLLRILPASDVATIGDALDVAGFVVIGAAALCLIGLPQGVRYARWFHGAAVTRSAMSTARGFPPPPVPARTSAYIIPADEQPGSRRRLYLALGGLAVGVGAGVGVIVSSSPATPGAASLDGRTPPGTSVAGASPAAPTQPAVAPPARRAPGDPQLAGPGSAVAGPPGGAGAGSAGQGRADAAQPAETVERMVAARRAALAGVDTGALAGLVTPAVFGFGVDAEEVAEGRDPVIAQIERDLGEPPAGGFKIESRALAIGQDRGHAWIAEEIEVSAPGDDPAGGGRRRFAITELAAVIDGTWKIVALHWATPVDDATAERLAILRTLPVPPAIPDRSDGAGSLAPAVRAAFASRAAFAEARSERVDAFNYGSGGERVQGGAAIKRLFTRLKAQIRTRDGARIVAGGAWDPAQKAAPWIGWAALNVDFTAKTRAATEVTQTFRVLAILVMEGSAWRIVQTHWSNAGPIR